MKKPRFTTVITTTVSLIMIVFLSSVYITQVRNAIKANSIDSIKELTMHDIKQTEGILERTWGELVSVINRIQNYRCKTLLDVQMRLTLERQSSSFYSIYLVDDAGNVYTDGLTILPKDKQHISALFEYYKERSFTVRYTDIEGISELRKSTLLYGVHTPPVMIDRINFVGIVGLKKISDIQTQMRIESFSGRGYTNIINTAGQYIVSKTLLSGINNNENFFSSLSRARILDNDIDSIKNSMDYKEQICYTFIDDKGKKSLVFMSPMNKLSWYFINVISYDVLEDQNRFFLTISAIMLCVTLIIIIVLLVLLFHSRQSTLKSNAISQARSEFLSNMSHEIRTPLNGLIGLNHLMTINIKREDLMRDYLAKASSTAKYLLSLVNDILDVSKLQAGKVELAKETVDLDALIEKVHDMQQNNMKNRAITFTVEKNLPYRYVVGDNVRIAQILMNLLGNAAKFTQKGGKVALRAYEGDKRDNSIEITFEVEDNGCGISEDFKAHLFESFSQDKLNRTASINGTGLGLSISNMLSHLMNGSISVKSALNVGSCFIVKIVVPLSKSQNGTGFVLDSNLAPAASPKTPWGVVADTLKEELENANQASATAKSQTPSPTPPTDISDAKGDGGDPLNDSDKIATSGDSRTNKILFSNNQKINVLIAEDNELNAQILTEILEINGFTCTLTHDGVEVVSTFSNSKPYEFDVVLMDVQMPRMNGYEAAKAIRNMERKDAKTTPIFACTANTFKEDRDKAYESGMNDFLSKPIDIGEMLQKLRMI